MIGHKLFFPESLNIKLFKMKRITILYAAVLPAFILFNSCSRQHATVSGSQKLVVSIAPLREVVSAIAGEGFTVEIMLPPGANHESYEPTPKDIMKLENASLFFTNGLLDFERNWISRFTGMYPSLKVVSLEKGIELLSGHEHDDGEKHGADPHTWLSLSAMKIQAATIKESLSERYPQQEEIFAKNLEALLQKINRADSTIRLKMDSLSNKTFLIYHPALGYFARDYGLTQLSIEEEGKEPSPASVKKIIDLVKRENIRFVLVSKEFDTRNATTIAQEAGIEVIVFDPMSSDWLQNMEQIASVISSTSNK